MHLCSHNLRIGLFADENLVRSENGTLVGPYGKLLNRMLFSRLPGNCSISVLPAVPDDESVGNSTWFNMWQNNSIDWVFVDRKLGDNDGITENQEKTQIVGSKTFGVAQFVAPLSKKVDALHFLVNNIHLSGFIIFGYMLIAVLATILPKLTHSNGSSRLKSLKTILFHTPFIDHNQLPRLALRLLFLCFGCFQFLNLNFLSSSIKTEKVAIPTDEFVDSISKLIKTPKTLAFGDESLSLFKAAPNDTLLQQLSKKDLIMVDNLNDLSQMKSIGLHRYLLVGDHNDLIYLMGLVSKHASENGLIAFHKSTDYFEYLSVSLVRKNLEEDRKNFINSRLVRSLEHGIFPTLRKKLEEPLKLRVEKYLKVYEDLETFVDDLSQKVSPNVNLENFLNLFLYPGGFFILVLLVWATDLFMFKRLQKISRKIVLYFTILRSTVAQGICHRLYLFGGWAPILGR